MSRIDELIQELCPDGVRFVTIGEAATVTAGATPSKSVASYWTNGTIPWLSSGEVNKGTIHEADIFITQEGYDSCSTRMVPAGAVVIALAGQGKTRGMVARTRLESCTNQSLASVVPDSDELDSDFLFHYLKTQYARLRQVSSGDGTRGGLNLLMIRAYRIPVPPLEVQREIVRVLDKFTQLEAELETELEADLEARRAQYEHYRTEFLTFGEEFPRRRLDEVAVYANGKAHEKLVVDGSEIPLVTARFISRNGEANRYVPLEDVLMPGRTGDVALVLSDLPNGRALARTFFVDRNDKYAINQRVARITVKDPAEMNPKFLHFVLDRNRGLLKYDNGVDQTHLSKGQVTGLMIPAPSIDEQSRIVDDLERFHALVNDISIGLRAELVARRQQYEHYRDRLLTFEELPA